MSDIVNNTFITFTEGPLIGKSLHSLWLRERLSDKKHLDQINLQRLYEPSLLDENIYIEKFLHKGNNLMIILYYQTKIIYKKFF